MKPNKTFTRTSKKHHSFVTLLLTTGEARRWPIDNYPIMDYSSDDSWSALCRFIISEFLFFSFRHGSLITNLF